MTRRDWLASAIGGAVCFAAPNGDGAGHLAVINDEAGLTRAETFGFAKQYGIRAIELRSAQTPKLSYVERLPDAELKELKTQLDDAGLFASTLDSSLLKIVFPGTTAVTREDFYVNYYAGLGLTDESMYRDRLEMLKRTIHAAHLVGAPNVRVFAYWRVANPQMILKRVAEDMSRMAEVAEREKLRLVLETEMSTNVATSDEAAQMMKLVPSPAFGINWDPQNSLEYESKPFPDGYNKLPKDRIWNVHVKAEGLFGPKHPLPWDAIIPAMLKDGYSGKFSLETHRGHDARNVAASRQCVEKLLKILQQG
ncbi:MAG TPA: sugar phosphate isomerase/epimerase family protein [Bryobacteraceae bacterium]|nr:sugar phosphate isomerase/epimerase family protein [Bryobacteraceae bacterium]